MFVQVLYSISPTEASESGAGCGGMKIYLILERLSQTSNDSDSGSNIDSNIVCVGHILESTSSH